MPIFEIQRDITKKVDNVFPILDVKRLPIGKYDFTASGLLIPIHIEADDAVRIFVKRIKKECDPKLGIIMGTKDGICLDQILRSMAEIRITPDWNETIAKIITPNGARQFSLERQIKEFERLRI